MLDPTYERTFDYLPIVGYDVDADADGIIQIVVDRVPPGVSWLVNRITFKTSDAPSPIAGPPPATFELFAESPPAGGGIPSGISLRAYAQGYTEAEADNAAPIRFWPLETLLARWAGFTASFDATVYLEVQVIERIPPAPAEAEAPGGEVALEAGDTPEAEGWN